VFQGDGEEALPAFIQNFAAKTFDTVPNLSYRVGSEVRVNEQRDITDLNSLPPPDFGNDDLQCMINEKPVIPLQASRGCYWGKCAFCNFEKHYRTRNIASVVDEMEVQAKRYSTDQFLFLDDSISPSLLEAIADEIIKRKLRIIYSVFYIRPEKGLTYELLKKTHDSGLRCISLGVESVTQRLLDAVNKGTQVAHIETIINHCEKIGILTLMFYIVGLPTQTKDELLQERPFIEKYVHRLRVKDFFVSRDTRIGNAPESYNIVIRQPNILLVSPTGTIQSYTYDFAFQFGLHPKEMKRLALERLYDHNSYFMITRVLESYCKFGWDNRNIGGCILATFRKHLAKGVRVEPTAQDISYLSGIGNMLMGNHQKALVQFRTLLPRIQTIAMKARILFHMGRCFLRIEDYENALNSFLIALPLHSTNGILYRYMAETQYYLGNYEQALASAQIALVRGYGGEKVQVLIKQCKKHLQDRAIHSELSPDNSDTAV
jgi:hypothetical protein